MLTGKKVNEQAFKQTLDQQHHWPSLYMFKFIVPHERANAIRALFAKNEILEKPSRNGKYLSLTAKVMMPGSDAVMNVYRKAYQVPGVISL